MHGNNEVEAFYFIFYFIIGAVVVVVVAVVIKITFGANKCEKVQSINKKA